MEEEGEAGSPRTQSPNKVVFRPGGQHGQIQVDHLSIEGRGGDKIIINITLHRTHFADGKEDQERDEAGGQLLNNGCLWGKKKQTESIDNLSKLKIVLFFY